MSTGVRLAFDDALELAGALVDELRPAVKRLKVAGSLRRRRPDVGDIEIVAEPHLYAADLFGRLEPDLTEVRYIARSWGPLLKNGDRMIQVGDVHGRIGFKCELYLVHPPAQWGSILAIRTGPADLGQIAMGRMLAFGYKHRQGLVFRIADRHVMPTPTEEEFFRYADLPLVPPARRDELAARVLAEIQAAKAKRA